jgi:diaminopimelate decarboxylase
MAHTAIATWPVRDGCVEVGGQPLTQIAARAGRTPFYAYDRQRLAARARELREHLPPDVHVHYAVKANPMPALVAFMATLVDGIDVASAGELAVALDAGAPPSGISFAGPAKQADELRAAIAAGILVNVESRREVALLAELSRSLGLPARVSVRVNPDFELKQSGMRMGGGAKPFGIDAEIVPNVLREIGDAGLSFEGFHLFWGSQNLNAEAIGDAQRKSVDLAMRLAAHAPSDVLTINIGGGFGIPYFPGERSLDLAPIGANLRRLVERTREALPRTRLVVELGRYLVGEAGVYVCRVIDRKVSRGQVFLVTDGGLHHHLAASGNFGQVLRKNYPVAIGNRMHSERRETVSVVGPLCTPLDLLADRMELAEAAPGDFVVVFQSGAYGATASPQRFLGHPPPVEILV